MDSRAILAALVGFDTTSRSSNLALIEWVETYLARHGVTARRVVSGDGTKANLLATLGPAEPGGVVLSGHTDVVPVDGQAWTSDPFVLAERDGRLYGRGTCDMKGFIAAALGAVPAFQSAPLRRPVHLAFSYDEEVGCFGAPAMIETIVRDLPPVAAVVVGEPTLMRAVGGHKGAAFFRLTVIGREAHSSQPHLGLSANMMAAKVVADLVALAEELAARPAGSAQGAFDPPFPTLTVGRIDGGTAANILAGRCEVTFDLRVTPGLDPHAVLAPIQARVAALDAQMKQRFPETGMVLETLADVPPFAFEADGVADALARALTGDNGPPRGVTFASEAGQFQGAGMSVVVCGPGSIDQAHQPDEFIALDQMRQADDFMRRLAERLSA